ncbi:sensor histidine kinase [Rhodococcus sp. WAY2]|uniref:sensor histidine kinase n=1 Tax=Rhodococcus sp. WAY2 TaxID=2663121 RepID=UPI001320165C|nr:two-component system sensor kinase [Rhodococcus sp. WAY2]
MSNAVPSAAQTGGGPLMPPVAPGDVPMPRLERRAAGRVVGGVAGGIADQLGVDVLKVRVVFAALAALAGAGIVAYGLLWIFTSAGADTEKPSASERRRAIGLIAIGLAGASALSWLFSGRAGSVIAPIIVVAVGAALVWREFDSEGPRTVIGLPQRPTVLTWARVLGGVTLIVSGLGVVILAQVDLEALRSSLLAVVVTLVGAGLLTVPLWLRLWRALGAERAARIRNEEREEIASHLHDSVLQTLALIQKQADHPQEVARLARGQERELRKWLFGGGDADQSSLAEALRIIAGEVEDQHGVTVRPVTVGDVSLDVEGTGEGLSKESFTALLGATREALVNAAKHSGETDINLFAEAEREQVSVFVRDRGVGFDIDEVPPDRQGLAKSIRGRIDRRGGHVDVRSAPGKGTEVRISMPRNGHAKAGAEATEITDDAGLEWGDTTVHAEEQPQ